MPLPSGAVLDFSGSALVMAIINCTNDSFYAASRALADEAVDRALAAEADGADIIDFGGESSRPGAEYTSEAEELARLLPVITAFRKRSSLAVSVDTRKSAVAAAVLDAGADIINDISALDDDPLMAELCARRRAAVVLMHKRGIPRTMQEAPAYGDVVAEVAAYLAGAAQRAEAAGISREQIIIDPGIGFGKQLEDNLEILRRMDCFTRLATSAGRYGAAPRMGGSERPAQRGWSEGGVPPPSIKIDLHSEPQAGIAETRGNDYPVLIGLSRKVFIGAVTGRGAEERLAGTIAANAAAIMGGAAIIRVHDVKEHADLVKMLSAINNGAAIADGAAINGGAGADTPNATEQAPRR